MAGGSSEIAIRWMSLDPSNDKSMQYENINPYLATFFASLSLQLGILSLLISAMVPFALIWEYFSKLIGPWDIETKF